MNTASVRINPGRTPPTITTRELTLKEVVVTEQATEAGLPIVDMMFLDEEGHLNRLRLTGRVVNSISAVIRCVNLRIHGVEEP